MTQERATDLLVRHNLNVNLAIEEHLTSAPSNAPAISVTPTPPSPTPTEVNDLDILWDPIPTKPTVARANSTPNYNKPASTSTSGLNDLSDIFGSIPVTSSAPAPVHKKDGRSKSLSSATSPFADFEFGDDSKKSKKDKKDKRLSLGGGGELPKDIMSSFDEDDSKKLDRKKSERQLKKEEKEKKKLEEEKKKAEEKEKKRLEKEKKKAEEEKKKEEKKRQSLKPHEIAEAMASHHSETSIGSGTSSTTEEPIEEEEELSKHDETVMQWMPKLKKAHKSCLLTINNASSLYLEIVKCHEDKGKWRRKPAEMIHPKSSIQFGVESKHSVSGYVHYSVEGYSSNIEFSWSFDKDKPSIVFNVPSVFKSLESSSHDRANEKFADIVFDLKEIVDNSSNNNGESALATSSAISASSNSNMSNSGESLNNSNASNSSILSDLVGSSKFKMEDSSEATNNSSTPSTANNSDSDSSDDEEEIRKQKTLFRNISFKPKEQVEEVDSATLQNAALSLKMPTLGGLGSVGSGGTVGRRGRNTINLTTKPSLVNSSPSSISTSSITTVHTNTNPQQQQQQDEQPDKIYSKSMGSLPSVSTHASKERMDPVIIDENAKTLIRTAFSNLERGDFKEALANVNEILRIVILLEDPLVKQKEAKISSIYKLALKLLLLKSSLEQEHSSSSKIAILTIFLSELSLQPKHRVICIRMAIKANLHIKNYGISARLLQMILPLNLADRSMQESQLATCKENNLHDNSFTIISPAFCCSESLELISTPTYYSCEYCDAKFSMAIGQELRKCSFCNYGNLHVLSTKR